MRQQRAGTLWYAGPVLAGTLLVGVAALRSGSSALAIAALMAGVIAVTWIWLLVLARRDHKRLASRVASGESLWGSMSVVLRGDSLLAGAAKLPHPPPGPKGALLVTPTSVVWEPDRYTTKKRYLRTEWRISSVALTPAGSSRDFSGVAVDHWVLATAGGEIDFQTYGATGDLTEILRNLGE